MPGSAGRLPTSFDALERQPACHQLELGLQSRSGVRRCLRLEGDVLHQQARPLPVRLQIDPSHQPIIPQEGQDIVTVHPLFGRRVDLDPVAEAEQALGAASLPDERIERGEQLRSVDPARPAGVAVEESLLGPALDACGKERAFLDQFGDRGT